MSRKVYLCSAREWEFARLFSSASGSSKGFRNRPYLGCLAAPIVWVVMLVAYYAIEALLPGSKAGVEWLKEWSIAAGIIIGGFLFVRALLKSSGSYVQPNPSDTLSFVATDSSGLSFNLYNNEDPKVLPRFLWSDIKTVHVDRTKDLRHYDGGRNYPYQRERRIAELNSRYAEHPPEAAKDIYEDRFTLLLNKGRGKGASTFRYAVIQVPPSWLHNGSLQSLLHDIESYSGARIQPYDEQAARLFAAWANRSQR